MECDGHHVTDPRSPYFGAAVPDPNSAGTYSAGKFLRGGKDSGNLQEGTATTGRDFSLADREESRLLNGGVPWQDDFAHPQVTFHYCRPVNMTVVWIIRVK